eukprot:1600286-Rhodomonas_salina.1
MPDLAPTPSSFAPPLYPTPTSLSMLARSLPSLAVASLLLCLPPPRTGLGALRGRRRGLCVGRGRQRRCPHLKT